MIGKLTQFSTLCKNIEVSTKHFVGTSKRDLKSNVLDYCGEDMSDQAPVY